MHAVQKFAIERGEVERHRRRRYGRAIGAVKCMWPGSASCLWTCARAALPAQECDDRQRAVHHPIDTALDTWYVSRTVSQAPRFALFAIEKRRGIWQGQRSRKFPSNVQDRALRKLRQLDASQTLEDLRNPPGNQLEALRADRSGQRSVRINDQWRILLSMVQGRGARCRDRRLSLRC
jgi:proteic killer suppression protein